MKEMSLIPALDYLGPTEILYTSLTSAALEIPVFTLFNSQVQLRPDKLAVRDENGSYTYFELWQKACLIAKNIAGNTGNENLPIGIWLENDRHFIAVMLAALALGKPYVGLDISMPLERNQEILHQAGIGSLISLSSFRHEVETFGISQVVYLDELQEIGPVPFEGTGISDSLAYIIYTSGTTGKPKGVFQNQRNLIHDVSQYIDSIHLSHNDRTSLLYSPTVNGAIRDIFGTLLTGATLYIRNLRQHGLASLALFIKTHQLTIYHSVPSIFRGFLQISGKQEFSSIRLIYLAGDRIVMDDVDRYKRHFPSAFLYIGIGSTENATIYRQWFVSHQTVLTGTSLPVGYAVPDRDMRLLNVDGSLTLSGKEGEIVVESNYMALGYWQNPELTQSSFTITDYGRRFRTGDLGRIRHDGLLEFIGRKDRQIKVAGHRVELAAVEAVLRQAPGVIELAVIGRQVSEEQVLVVYLIRNGELDVKEVKHYCREQLPAYMMPAHWEMIDALPLLPNFKVDLSALLQMDTLRIQEDRSQSEHIQTDSVTKNSWIQQVLQEMWSSSGEGLKESYHANVAWRNGGGSSLDAVAFMVKLEEKLGIEIPAEWIYGDMKPQWLEEQLLQRADQIQRPLILRNRPIIYFFPALHGLGEGIKLLRDLQQNAEVHLISYPDWTQRDSVDFGFESFMKKIMKQILNLPKPDLIIGFCSGTFPAHETVHRLKLVGQATAPLVLIDFPAPLGGMVPLRSLENFTFGEVLQIIKTIGLKKTTADIIRSLFPTWANWFLWSSHRYFRDISYNAFKGTVRLGHVSEEVHLFKMKDHKFELGMRWEWLCRSLAITEFPFMHSEMLPDKNNRQMLLKAVLNVIKRTEIVEETINTN